MKTLDEVINALEICGHDESPKCPYFDTEHWSCCEDHMRSISPLKNDALYYLKEYQRYQNTPSRIGHMAMCDENEPLTWDELKGMEGKPVWVEALLYKQWAIIAYIGVDHIRFEGANLYAPECRVYMGADNGWQAYRKKR